MKKYFILAILSVFTKNVFANEVTCLPLFSNLLPFQEKTIADYKTATDASPFVEKVFPVTLVGELVRDEERPLVHERFNQVLTAISQAVRENKKISSLKKIIADTALVNKVPASSVEARIKNYFKSPSRATLNQMMGEITLSELQTLIHGGDPLNPTPESLLGQYIARTQSATLVRQFPQGPNATTLGSPKLAIALSAQSWPVYIELFGIPNFLIHVHDPMQGTLHLGFNKKYGNYANLASDLRFPRIGSILPHALFSSTEAERMNLFLIASRMGFYSENQFPWSLVDDQNRNYCARGGYNSCTHWVGNMPIGDRRVDAYSLPGRVDQYASNLDQSHDASPKTQSLIPHHHKARIVQLVWKTPGHEQFADVMGLNAQNLAGELANPGYVAFSLIGHTTAERVPFVFVAVENHQTPLTPDFQLQIRAY